MVSTLNERSQKLLTLRLSHGVLFHDFFLLIGVFLVMAAAEMRARRQTHGLKKEDGLPFLDSRSICNDDYKSTM